MAPCRIQRGMADPACELVNAWIDAYYSKRDEEMILLAHRAIEIRPRPGHGERLHREIDGLQRWLDDTQGTRSAIHTYSTVRLPDGRVLAEATLGEMGLAGLFNVRDEKIAGVTMYISDREMLVQLGKIDSPRASASVHRVSGTRVEARARRQRRA
jgi:hypothetical protein